MYSDALTVEQKKVELQNNNNNNNNNNLSCNFSLNWPYLSLGLCKGAI